MTANNNGHSCNGKQPIGSFDEAQLVAQRIRRKKGGTAAPYRCRACGQFHVGGNEGQGQVHKARDYKRRRREVTAE